MAFAKLVAVVASVGLAVYLQGCGGGGDGPGPVPLGNTIPGIASKTEELSTLVSLLKTADLVDTLAGPGPFTVFAPNNAAFNKVPNATLAYLGANKPALKKVLEYHVASGNVTSTELKDSEKIPTLEGLNVTVSIDGSTVKINNAIVTQANVKASNGEVHIIDSVLIPANLDAPKIPALATGDKDLSTLVAALKAADLVTALEAAGPFTVFAPTNKAFAAIPSVVTYLLKPENKAKLVQVLKYHVASGEVLSQDLKNGEQITTLEGQKVNVSIDGSTVKINSATVTTANVLALNGAVHIIDSVLIPANLDAPKIPALATGDKDLSTLVAALTAADLVTALEAAGPFTVFAPTNEAFTALNTTIPGVLTNLLKPENKAKLVQVLKYHVASGEVLSQDLKNGEQITTLEGQKANVSIDGSTVKINSATVTTANVLALNGAVHIIDAVLVPPGFQPPGFETSAASTLQDSCVPECPWPHLPCQSCDGDGRGPLPCCGGLQCVRPGAGAHYCMKPTTIV